MRGTEFILGCPRSGTSVLSWAIAQHADFWTSAESDVLQLLFGNGHLHRAYKTAYERPDHGWLYKNKVTFREFCAYLGLGADQLFSSRAGGRRWVDATPGHTLMAHELALLFPRASFVHIVRDGRAVVNSMIQSGFDAKWASDFNLACETWTHFVRTGSRFERQCRERVLRVRHEQLVADPEGELRRVFDFLGA